MSGVRCRTVKQLRRYWQGGFSLVESLIAMALGMLFLVAMVSMYLSNAGLQRELEAVARIQEQGRLVVELLGRDLRQAGFRHALTALDEFARPASALAVLGCRQGRFASGFPSDVLQVPLRPPCESSMPVGAVDADALYVQYETGEPRGGDHTGHYFADVSRGRGANCLGQWPRMIREDRMGRVFTFSDVSGAATLPPDTRVATPVVQNLYYVDPRPASDSPGGRLMCMAVGKNGTLEGPQPLASGIHQLRILYGLADSAGAISNPRSAETMAPADWAAVSSVHLCLILVVHEPVLAQRTAHDLDCAAAAAPFGAEASASSGTVRDPVGDVARGLVMRRFDASFFLRNRGQNAM